jgi:chromosome segregation ATPase
MAGSIAYIYVYLRGKLDAGERRRRLVEERDGAQRLLGGAIKELGLTILSEGIQHADLTGLLEAVGRAEARREAALADIVASEKLQAAEEARLSALEAALEAEWSAADRASREAEELTRGVSTENQEAAARLGRVRDDRARREREAELAEASPEGKQRAAHLRHEAAGLRSEQAALEEQVARLDGRSVSMRQQSAALRAAMQAARLELEGAIATRRSAGTAMKASIAGHIRERADAEREVADLTEQLGRAAAQARSTVPLLMPAYQRIDRLQESIDDRASQIAAIEQSLAHYDEKKLLTGVGLVTSMLAAAAVMLWVVLR